MTEANSLDATLFAFKKRDRRFVLTRATFAYLLLALALGAAYVGAIWPLLDDLFRWYIDVVHSVTKGVAPPSPPMRALMSFAPWALLYTIIGGLLRAAYEAACLRWLVRQESGGGLLGLRFSADTARVFATYLVWIGLLLALCIGVITFYLGVRAISAIGGPFGVIATIIGAITPLCVGAIAIWVAVRLAPAAAIIVARERFAFFGAWGVTRGRFWPLLGAFFLLIVGYFVITSVMGQIAQFPLQQKIAPVMVSVMSGAELERAFALLRQELLTPPFLALLGVYIAAATVLACLFRVAFFGVNARAVLAAQEATAST